MSDADVGCMQLLELKAVWVRGGKAGINILSNKQYAPWFLVAWAGCSSANQQAGGSRDSAAAASHADDQQGGLEDDSMGPQQQAYQPAEDELVLLLSAKIDGVPSVGADMVKARRDGVGRVVALYSPHLEGI